MTAKLDLKIQGVLGKQLIPHRNKGQAVIYVDHDRDQVIHADAFVGYGPDYQRREKSLINIEKDGGVIFSGTFAELARTLRDGLEYRRERGYWLGDVVHVVYGIENSGGGGGGGGNGRETVLIVRSGRELAEATFQNARSSYSEVRLDRCRVEEDETGEFRFSRLETLRSYSLAEDGELIRCPNCWSFVPEKELEREPVSPYDLKACDKCRLRKSEAEEEQQQRRSETESGDK